ncbi:hypothetical protein ACYUJ6_14230 [Clostridium sp. JNZ X4-2]
MNEIKIILDKVVTALTATSGIEAVILGGWLIINGYHVDFILRDVAWVENVITECQEGSISAHYRTGHPPVVTVSSASHAQGGAPYLNDIELKDHYKHVRSTLKKNIFGMLISFIELYRFSYIYRFKICLYSI